MLLILVRLLCILVMFLMMHMVKVIYKKDAKEGFISSIFFTIVMLPYIYILLVDFNN